MAATTADASAAMGHIPQPVGAEKKGSCSDHGFCSEEEQNKAYMAVLQRLKSEGVLKALRPDSRGMLRINVPFAGKFAERDLLMAFLRTEVLNRRSDIRFIHILVTDIQDFSEKTDPVVRDPHIFISYLVQDGTVPLPPAQLLLGMHPDCSSRFLTDFGIPYRRYYYLWQRILHQTAMSCTQVAVFCNLWLEEAIEVQNVTRHAGMMSSAPLKNELYYGQTVTSPLTANKRDRKPFHYIVIADRAPFQVVPKIVTSDEDYTGPYHNFWTLAEERAREAMKLRNDLAWRDTSSGSESGSDISSDSDQSEGMWGL